MSKGTLKIHSENILPIIKKWLYSEKDIFLRELVSNATDALSKLKILRDQQETSFKDEELRIDIVIDKENKRLTIKDTGLGMSAHEVETYIAQLAFSGAEDFMKKYDSAQDKDQIIGHFGLGFYSAFMVASKVEIITKSYKDEPAAHWTCDGSPEFTLVPSDKTERGSEIILHIAVGVKGTPTSDFTTSATTSAPTATTKILATSKVSTAKTTTRVTTTQSSTRATTRATTKATIARATTKATTTTSPKSIVASVQKILLTLQIKDTPTHTTQTNALSTPLSINLSRRKRPETKRVVTAVNTILMMNKTTTIKNEF
jgi:hypothetical protein